MLMKIFGELIENVSRYKSCTNFRFMRLEQIEERMQTEEKEEHLTL